MTAAGCLCLSSVVGKKVLAGVDTYPYFSTQLFSSRLRPRQLIRHMGTWTNLSCQCDNSSTGMSACKSPISMVMRERNNFVEGGRKRQKQPNARKVPRFTDGWSCPLMA